MEQFRWNLIIMVVICLQLVVGLPIRAKRQDDEAITFTLNSQSNLNPIDAEDSSAPLGREKRKLPDATFAAKNAVLGFVFGDVQSGGRKSRAVDGNLDVADLNRDKVMFDVPDELFTQSFTTVTNVSKILSDFMKNSARRYAKIIYFFKPLFGDALTVEGHDYVSTTTTTTKKPKT